MVKRQSSMSKKRLLGLLVITVLLFGLAGVVQAQSKTYIWDRLDVDITVLDNSNIRIVESQQFTYVSGEFHFGYREIPTDRLERITDVEVWEGDRQYQPGRGGDYTYETFYNDDGDFTIKWYYPGYHDSTHTYTIKYTVKGGLRFYEGGDQVYWKAVFPDRTVPVLASVVTVHLPAAFDPDQLVIAAYDGSRGDRRDVQIQNKGSEVVFTAGRTQPDHELEVRVQFPHGVVHGTPAGWQAAYDRKAEYDDKYRPLVDLGLGAIGLLILVAGPLALFVLWYTRGRDVPVPMVADYLSDPPSDLRAGVAGTLLDEKADMKDIVATIVDLARRGVITMTETQERGFLGLGTKRDFTFRLVDTGQSLRPYERTLIKKLVGGRSQVDLSDLKEKFYKAIPTLRRELYDEVVKAGFFKASPERTRHVYLGLGIAGIVVAGLLGVGAVVLLSKYTSAAVCPPIGLGVTAISFFIMGHFMPRKTREGSVAAANWNAFKRYLASIEKYTDLQQATELFDKYLPYAIAFGLEKSWIRKFASVETPAPTWYYPYPPVV